MSEVGDEGPDDAFPCISLVCPRNIAAMALDVIDGGMLSSSSDPMDCVLTGEDVREPDLGEDVAGEELWMNLHLVP